MESNFWYSIITIIVGFVISFINIKLYDDCNSAIIMFIIILFILFGVLMTVFGMIGVGGSLFYN